MTGAKDKKSEDAAGHDLYIKFTDVRIDHNSYYIYLSIHFIDPNTGVERARIPARAYSGGIGGFERHLRTALEEVALKIQVEVTGATEKK